MSKSTRTQAPDSAPPDPETAAKVVELAASLSAATKPKKPRTDSPETIALRMHREHRQIAERIQAELDRHHERINGLQGELERHDDKCKAQPPEVRVLLERLMGVE